MCQPYPFRRGGGRHNSTETANKESENFVRFRQSTIGDCVTARATATATATASVWCGFFEGEVLRAEVPKKSDTREFRQTSGKRRFRVRRLSYEKK